MKQALICCAIAFVITAAIGPSVIRYLRKMKFGQKILEIGPKWHMNKQNIPTMGGFMFIIGIALAVIIGGLITGTEVTPEHPEGIAFGMYHADQYVAPEGQYTTVHAVDGTAWYKQYAADAVEKSPYMAPDGSIAYHESIVKKLPPTPKRKDKL